ncbi:MAG: hypothetical protein PHY45_10230, partial [Rhodocyclaceae bacterium]|nr:hypothetical protein [Rhodocyclaceae bacterium]
RVAAALRKFDDSLADLIDPAHIRIGGYHGEDRRGQDVFHALPALSAGCLVVEPGHFQSHHEVSAAVTEAKKQAKKIPGSALFVERRRLAPASESSDDAIVVPGLQSAPVAVRAAEAMASA